MTSKILAYELFLLSIVSLTLLFVALKNKGVKELIYLFGGLLLVTISRTYVFLGKPNLAPIFYVITAGGYFLIALAIVKLANYLRSVKVLEHTAFYDPLTKAYREVIKEEFCILLIDLNDFKQVAEAHRCSRERLY